MSKKIKISKLAIVIFLTVLIWVWADLSLEETHPVSTATIVIGRAKPNLWVSFPQGSSIDVNEIILKGPASVVNNIERAINNDPSKLVFPLLIEQFDIDKAGEYKLPVSSIIKQSIWIKESGLSIDTCDPCEVQVNVVALSEREIDVKCYDEQELPIELESPQKVKMYVPSNWGGTTARVVLSYEDKQRAIKQAIDKKPHIVLPNGQKKEADTAVAIKLSPQENMPERKKVEDATLGYVLSENLLKGQYNIVVENLPDILTIEIYSTPEAKAEYESQLYQVLLFVKEDDIKETVENKFVRREVYYTLPEDFVRTDQIKLADKKVEAHFTVTPIEPPEIAP